MLFTVPTSTNVAFFEYDPPYERGNKRCFDPFVCLSVFCLSVTFANWRHGMPASNCHRRQAYRFATQYRVYVNLGKQVSKVIWRKAASPMDSDAARTSRWSVMRNARCRRVQELTHRYHVHPHYCTVYSTDT